jgi:lipoprotein-anchoring transpeptidase ErfK/SrfK
MSRAIKRTGVVLAVVLVVVGAGVAAYTLVPWQGSDASASPPRPRHPSLSAWPPAGATGVPLRADIRVDVHDQRLTKLTVKSPDGLEIPGYLGRRGDWWLTRTTLAPGTAYEVTARLKTPGRRPKLRHWTFTTMPATGALGVRVVPGDNEVVGVGQVIALRFTAPVADKAAVERRLLVTTSVPVEGSWRWFGDREARWRPQSYWPANTEVSFDADLDGVDAGNGIIGNVHRTAHFRIGNAHVSTANAQAHTLTVTENGAVIKQFPMSAGKEDFPTMSGTHVVLGKAASVVMDSRTNGVPLDSADGYLETVLWDTQISSTGEYVHAAPWSVGSQGRANVSHGCINLSPENAEWFYNWSYRGDIVQVNGTTKPANNDPAMIDWKLPYDQWEQGSAVYQAPVRTRVRIR